MSDEQPLIPVWFAGDPYGCAPTRTYLHEGAKWPDEDSHGRKMYEGHHHLEWTDARDELLKQWRAGLRLATRSLIDAEGEVEQRRLEVADAAKKLYAVQQMDEP